VVRSVRVVVSAAHCSTHAFVEVRRRTAKVDGRETSPLTLVDEQLLDCDEVLRVVGRVAAEVDELGGDFGEKGFALRAHRAVEGLCESGRRKVSSSSQGKETAGGWMTKREKGRRVEEGSEGR
jgi:hypothetical protein